MNPIKAVCFDLDDTICDLWEGEKTARSKLLEIITERTGRNREEIAEVYDSEWDKVKQEYMNWVAKGLDEADLREMHMNNLFKVLSLDSGARELAELHCRTTMDDIYIYPDARTVLDKLKEKYRLCMITNGPPAWQREKIRKLGIEGYFEEIIVSGEIGHHKPDPKIFQEMTNRTGVPPSEIIYIGNDYRKDILGAKASGWHTAWVKRMEEARDETVPSHIINELSDLLDIL